LTIDINGCGHDVTNLHLKSKTILWVININAVLTTPCRDATRIRAEPAAVYSVPSATHCVLWWCFRTTVFMALKIDIVQVANALNMLAEAVRAVHVRISIDAMFELTQQAAAGRTGQVW